jgi:hypothetical protein
MKVILLILVILPLITACKTTAPVGPTQADLHRGINIRQGMDTAELTSLLGEPDYKQPDFLFNKLKMERWHYEIVLESVKGFQELDTELVLSYSTMAHTVEEVEQPVDVYVESEKKQIIDILVKNGSVYAVSSQLQSDFDTPGH